MPNDLAVERKVIASPLGLLAVILAVTYWSSSRILTTVAVDRQERWALVLAMAPALLGLGSLGGFFIGYPGLGGAACAATVSLVFALGRRREPTATYGASDSSLRLMTAGLALFGMGVLGTTLVMPVWGGAARFGDWAMNWFVTTFYLNLPFPDLRDYIKLMGFDLKELSRTPLFNLELTVALGAGGAQFWLFQIAAAVVGLPLIGALLLWARNAGGDSAVRWMLGLSALSPFLLQNTAYPWAKALAATFTLLFLHFVLAAVLARAERRRHHALILASACMSLGFMAHQTALFYAVATAVWLAWRRPATLRLVRPRIWLCAAAVALTILVPWHAWALASQGLQAMIRLTPAIYDIKVNTEAFGWARKTAVVAAGTLIPLRIVAALASDQWPDLESLMRVPIGTLPGAIGLGSCFMLVRRCWGGWKRAGHFRRSTIGATVRGRTWWGLVFAFGFFAQAALQSDWTRNGNASESMTPLVGLAMAYAAASASTASRIVRPVYRVAVIFEAGLFHALLGWWAFGPAGMRDPNLRLVSSYGLEHLRGVWPEAALVGTLLLTASLAIGVAVLCSRSPTRLT